MNMNTKLIMIFAIILFQSCKTQRLETETSLPKVEVMSGLQIALRLKTWQICGCMRGSELMPKPCV